MSGGGSNAKVSLRMGVAAENEEAHTRVREGGKDASCPQSTSLTAGRAVGRGNVLPSDQWCEATNRRDTPLPLPTTWSISSFDRRNMLTDVLSSSARRARSLTDSAACLVPSAVCWVTSEISFIDLAIA